MCMDHDLLLNRVDVRAILAQIPLKIMLSTANTTIYKYMVWNFNVSAWSGRVVLAVRFSFFQLI